MQENILQNELQGLDNNTSLTIQNEFAQYFGNIDSLKERLSTIQVTDISQKSEMQQAREIRLALKDMRVSADKTRKRLKEDSLRYGKAVQGVYNVLEYMIAPLEKQAEEQEKFIEIQSMKLRAELKAKREIESSNYSEFIPTSIDLGGLAEDEYQNLLSGAKLQLQNKIEQEAKAEAERIERERIEAEQREAMRLENERLRKEAEEKAKMLADMEAKAKKEAEEREKILAKQRESMEAQKREMEAKAKKELEEQAKKLAKEREAKAKLEAELKAKEQAEAKAKKEEQERIEAEEKARIQAEKKAQREPDKKKLETLAGMLELYKLPEMKTEEGKKVVENVKTLLGKVVTYIRDNNNKL